MFFFHALLRKFSGDNFFLARALSFDVLVCLIPVLLLLFLLFGFFFDSSDDTAQYMILYMKSMIPFSRPQLLKSLFAAVKVQKILSLLGIVGLFWILSRVFSSTRTVLNIVFEVKKVRGLIAGKFFDLEMIFLCSLFFLATVLITFLSSILKGISPDIPFYLFNEADTTRFHGLIRPSFGIGVLGLLFLYRVYPRRRNGVGMENQIARRGST